MMEAMMVDRDKDNFRSVIENPCHMCMPLGAILPFKGIENAMVIIHGSQGCATYMRRHIAEHYNEPIDVASSSISERGTIYGGEDNLKKGLDNLIKLYHPGIIGILTTCLAETIGEDVERISHDYLSERGMGEYPLVPVSTPGYGLSHSEGYFLAMKRIIARLARPAPAHRKINVITPNLSPADLREIKRILTLMGAEYVLCPDLSDTLDSPYSKTYSRIPAGGTPLAELAVMPGAPATIQFANTLEENISPGHYLESTFGVPLFNLPVPIGLEACDQFLDVLQQVTANQIPDRLLKERGRLLDAMIDSHKYNAQGRSVIFGEPDLVYALTRTCLENGIKPMVVATGSRNKILHELLTGQNMPWPVDACFLDEADFASIRILAKEKGANIAIGSSEGRYLTQREDIPLVRIGFPIHDRVGGQRLLSVGYTGTTMLLDRITNALLEDKQRHYRLNMYLSYFSGDQEMR